MNLTIEELERRLWIEGRHAERNVLLTVIEGWRQCAQEHEKAPGLWRFYNHGVRGGSVEAARQVMP